MLRVAVVGSGPAGLYAAAALVRRGDVAVDVLDRLPCPFGLVRYGVAPDHPKIKSISATLRTVLEEPAVRFLGNVEVGTDLTVEDLHRHYDAVVFAHGATVDRRLGIPGEDLPGSFSATDFVAWYSGHPDAPLDRFALQARGVVVIGVGNVALDVVRILAKPVELLRPTDVPDHVLDVLERSRVTDVHLVGRRGPEQAKFTTKELRELGELPDVDVLVDPAELAPDQPEAAAAPGVRRNLETLREWGGRRPTGAARRVHVRFRLRPVEVLGADVVTGVRFERTRVDEAGRATGTGETCDVAAQMLLRSVGYFGLPLLGVPFEPATGTVPHVDGRVLRDNVPVPGEYVTGWIKRGPTGVIGTNKHDANETIAALLADAPRLPRAPVRDPDAVPRLLADRGVDVVTWTGWCAIEAAEEALGQAQGRERVKLADRAALLATAAGSPASAAGDTLPRP